MLGLHWGLLQTVAWTGMIISYSREATFKVAIGQTFDGAHPCPLCKAIAKGRAEEKKQSHQAQSGSKLDLGLIWQPTEFHFAFAHEPFCLSSFAWSSRTDEPPKPHPRGNFDGHDVDA